MYQADKFLCANRLFVNVVTIFFKARHVSSAGCEVISIFDLQSWCHNSSAEKLLA